MSTYDQAAHEMEHIRAMIAQLEHLIPDSSARQVSPVTSPDYWRARIEALLAADLPPALGPQAHALLARLDAIRTSRSHALRGPHHP